MTLKIGMLWFDDNPKRSLGAKIDLAARYYRDKYGKAPTVCYVHPKSLMGTLALEESLQVLAAQHILPHHFWLGVGEAAGETPS